MKTTKTLRSRDFTAAKTRLQDLLSAHECYKGTYSAMTDKFMAMREQFNIPARQWAWLDGYYACRVDAWYRHKLAFGYAIDGVVYPQKWNLMPAEHKQLARDNKLVSAHYWMMDDGKLSNNKF